MAYFDGIKNDFINDSFASIAIVLVILILFNLIVFCLRKEIFKAIYINDEEIKITYRNNLYGKQAKQIRYFLDKYKIQVNYIYNGSLNKKLKKYF